MKQLNSDTLRAITGGAITMKLHYDGSIPTVRTAGCSPDCEAATSDELVAVPLWGTATKA